MKFLLLHILLFSQSITINHPNGGETWTVGEKRAIHWDWTGNFNSVKIEYSVDGGQNWILIASSTQNDGDYLWTVPNMVSSNCFVKISDVNDPAVYDISDLSFSIVRPQIRILKPNGGEYLRIGDIYPIEWNWTGKFSNVKIEYTTDGTTWITIVNSTQNDGDYYWTVPNTPSSLCRIRITNLDDPSSFDVSDNDFTIQQNVLTLITPNGGETYVTGEKYPITWDWQGSLSSVKIEYSVDNGNTWNVIVSSTQNDGSHYWTIPNSPSTSCLIKISDPSDPNIFDISDNTFTIVTTSLDLKTPDGGELFYVGDKVPIHWNWTGSISNVKIEYSVDGGNTWNLIVNSTQNDGDYLWTIPEIPTTQCRIKISNVDDPLVYDISTSNFIINRAEFEIIRPTEAESLIAGERYPIHWNWRGSVAGVKLELWYKTQSGVQWWTITANTQNDGSHYFDVPYYITDSAGIKITNVNDPNSFALSKVFKIVRPKIQVIYPNGGERLMEGEDIEIIWNTNGSINSVMLQYSIDGGNNWQTIISSTANDGSYHWNVPSGVWGNCLIKVINTGDIDNFDVSDSAFHIVNDTIRIKRPRTGDVYYITKKHPIYWTSLGGFSTAKLYYSIDGGVTWKLLTSSTPNKGYYIWQVDTPITSNARVRVVSNLNTGTYDISDVFTIADTTPISAQDLLVLSPISGDTFPVGGTCVITWHSKQFASPNQVDIYYSIDNGPWVYIATVSNSQQSYEWTVPNFVTDNCKILVQDVNGTASDVSDSFSIVLQKIRIVSPDSNKEWVVGKKYFILWNWTGSFQNAVIDYSYDGGNSWVNIASPTNNDGEYEWTIPNTPSTRCLVRIRNYENLNVVAISDTFTIKAQTIKITSPVKGDTLISGRKYYVTWDYTGAFSNVDIEYSIDGGNTWNTLVLSASNQQSYEWTISPGITSDQALIRVLNSANTNVFDISDTFVIIPQNINITSPSKNDNWIIGRKYYITWWNTGYFPNVKIEYSIDAGLSWNTITSSYSNNKNYEWTIPDVPSNTCLIKVSNVDNLNVYDISDTFVIPLQTINITYPSLNDVLISGRKYYITWDWTGTLSQVNIEYSIDGGNNWNTIQTNVNNSGSYEWQVPTSISNNCYIKISSSQNPSVFDISDQFSILPQQIIITSPESGDSLLAGRKYTITWKVIGNFSQANIWYSLDGGQNWLIIASNVSNNKRYEWTVPEVVSDNALIKIENSENVSVFGISDTFVISPPITTITSPLAGDIWYGERKYYITWNMLGNISQINLYYSLDNGNTWTPIILNQNNAGSYEWTVPAGLNSDSARIRLMSSSNFDIFVISDSFTIKATLIQESGREKIPDKFFVRNEVKHSDLIKFGVPFSSDLEIAIFDASGRRVFSKFMKALSPGIYQLKLDNYRKIPSGIYIMEFKAKKGNKIVFAQRIKFMKIK